jgi:hypothetical protein
MAEEFDPTEFEETKEEQAFNRIGLAYDSFVAYIKLLNTENRSEDEDGRMESNLKYISGTLSKFSEFMSDDLKAVFTDPKTFDKDATYWKEYLDARKKDPEKVSVAGIPNSEYRIAKTLDRYTKSLDSLLDAKLLELQSAIINTIMTASLLKEYERKEVLANAAKESGDYSVFDIMVEGTDMTSQEYAEMILEKAAVWHAIEDEAILALSKFRTTTANYILAKDIDNAKISLDALRAYDIVTTFLSN